MTPDLLPRELLEVALHCSSLLALAHRGRLLVVLPTADLGQDACLLAGALETAQRLGRPELLRLGAVARSENEPAIVEANIARLSALGFQPRHTIESGVADTVTAHSVNAHTAGARAS